ncbi:MAG TPA: aspartyl-phosphate phosphatase Spo0E family protein [Clostridiales bacterium]|nr:aspartyl-phosphate phosphatase Spo0E family protein [Clostridiales bacterium]
MAGMEELLKDIDILRENLNKLIEKKGFNLQDPEIIKASQELNHVIVQYNSFIEEKL